MRKATNPFDCRAFGRAVKDARNKLGLTRVEVEERYNIDARYLPEIENRGQHMSLQILGKTVSESYKKSKNRKTAPDEQYIFDGAIPIIVDEETWSNAQRLRKTVRRPPKRDKTPSHLTGLIYCADCNSKMTHRNTLVQKK